MKRKIVILFVIILGGLLYYLSQQTKKIELIGNSMGTTYRVIYYKPIYQSEEKIKSLIESKLNNINNIFSTYAYKSEVYQLNRNNSVNQIKISQELLDLLLLNKKLFNESNGLYDPTVKPLVDLWGFGIKDSISFPNIESINNIKKKVGLNKLIINQNTITKTASGIKLDFSSSAKGLAVDEVCDVLSRNYVKSYLVEIGGEIRGSENKGKDDFWVVGIIDPRKNKPNAYAKINLRNQAIATSGDYYQYFIHNNKFYSHIINPKTGYPIEHKLTSVSVVADNCVIADAYATFLMLMSVKNGIKFVEKNKNIEALFLIKSGKKIIPLKSSNFPYLITDN